MRDGEAQAKPEAGVSAGSDAALPLSVAVGAGAAMQRPLPPPLPPSVKPAEPKPAGAERPGKSAPAKSGPAKSDPAPETSAKLSQPAKRDSAPPKKEAAAAIAEAAARMDAAAKPEPPPVPADASAENTASSPRRRVSRRRPAGPVRNRIAANDDAPSIGGLIYALEQKPSTKPYTYAVVASSVWALIGGIFAWLLGSGEIASGATFAQFLTKPTTFLIFAAIVVPIALIWLMALLAWRAEELRLRSSTMTEVAVRLAEPDRMAEQSIASLGQAVRRQVSFMNDAVSRALGRAGELEALVHSEVTALERSYEENERKIRGLIQELSGERAALVNTGDKFSDTLRTLGSEVPALIEKLSTQQVKLAQIIQGAGENLTNLEGAIANSSGRLEATLGTRTQQLQSVLEDYTGAIGHALGTRTEQMQVLLGTYSEALGGALETRTQKMQAILVKHSEAIGGALEERTESMQKMLEGYAGVLSSALDSRSENMQTVFEEYTRALDTTIANRAAALDSQLVERTKALDSAFSERLRLFDESIQRSTLAIDSSVNEKALALTNALDHHAKSFAETVDRQAGELDEALMRGINSVRRSSENITRQSMKAIEGLSSQSDLLKSVSENLLGQIHNVTSRFEKQGQQILGAASTLETVNYKIDTTLQNRHADMNRTLDRLSNKADEFGRFLEGYSSSIEGSLTEAEVRARAVAEELKRGTETHQRAAIADLQRMKEEADTESARALADLRNRFTSVSSEMTEHIGSLSSRFDETSQEVRKQAARTAHELTEEQSRLRRELEQLPSTTRESADAVRRALQDQLKALDQLSSFTSRTAAERDVMPPLPVAAPPQPQRSVPEVGRSVPSLSSVLAQELSQRQRPATPLTGETVAGRTPHQGAPAGAAGGAGPGADNRAGWSLGDLLARASHDHDDDQSHHQRQHAAAPAAPHVPYTLDIGAVARALDTAAASAIWARLRVGQRGIMVRSIYTADGRIAFDEIGRRYKSDAELRATIDRYLTDFERLLRDSDAKDPSGRQAQSQIVADGGRVYLFLAHASGRLS